MKILLALTSCCLVLAACTSKSGGEVAAPLTAAEDLAARGKAIYVSNCIACHNVDPHKDGSVGPSIAGSPLELVQLRVMKAQYPAGYKAKRETSQMVALPHLEKEIPALHAYLNAN